MVYDEAPQAQRMLFYAGRSGGSPLNVFYICTVGTVLIQLVMKISGEFRRRGITSSIFEAVFLSLSLFFLVYSSSSLFILAILPIIFMKKSKPLGEKRSAPFSMLKLSTLFITAVCIIFVDFPFFPYEHPKVSHYLIDIDGFYRPLPYLDSFFPNPTYFSLMDVGAPLFVVLNGFSPTSAKKSLKSSCINFLLWIVRKVATSSVNYYSPEGEYSHGCNFFGYISAVHLFASIFALLKVPPALSAISLSVVHEISGCQYPIIGYLSLYFTAQSFNFKRIESLKGQKLAFFLAFCVFVYLLAEYKFIHPLREKSNSAFNLMVFLVAGFVVAVASLIGANYSEMSPLFMAIDSEPLLYFLIANVLTGAINLMIDTNHSQFDVCFFSVNAVFIVSALATQAIYEAKKSILERKIQQTRK